MNILGNIIPVLRVAQAATAGNPTPGLEGAIAGVVALAEMVLTMKGNKADLSELNKRLKRLMEFDTVGCSDDLKQRLDNLKQNFEPIATRLTSLGKKSKIKQFLQGKKEIQGIKVSITSCIQDFTFHNNISINKLLDQMSTKVDPVDTSLQKMESQGDQQGPSGWEGGQGRASKSPSGGGQIPAS
ncbi:hypothetical protein MVEN_01424300 [Mycena venus]|uniref:Uncharacterized protein n=1 Tax=Mycena venus TaxID=2733690 RepID=A0A8H7CSS8_9AGAR|nr:hypothetical protein MVEN_01424300 [Mycena venus]